MAVSEPNSMSELKPGTTRPCPGCGRPVLLQAAICTHCGQMIGREEQLATELKKAKKDGLPPIPKIAPGPGTFREPDADLDGIRMWQRAVAYFAFCMLVLVCWKGTSEGAGEMMAYLYRYGVTVAGAVAIAALCAMMFIDFGVSWRLTVFGVATAIVTGDFVQHTIISITPLLMPIAWALAIVACMFCLYDITDIEIPEAALLTFLIYLMKVVLKFTLFAGMFWKAAGGEGG